jgi:nucleoside-diphosphate-sugar epimerase
MKVLITGGGGFIGSHLVESQLAQGHFVRTVDLHADRLLHLANRPNLEIVTGDLTNGDLVKRLVNEIDIIYHLASAHLNVTLSDDYYRQVNVDATMRLLREAHKASVRRMVHCSTNGVVGEIKAPPVDETVACYPTNVYEKTKLVGEQEVLAYSCESGFPVVVVRPAWVYGPRCPRTEKLMRTVRKGRFLMLGDGHTLRHPIYISDAIQGLELCAGVEGASGQVYFIAGDRPVTIKELVQMVADVQGVQSPKVRLPIAAGKTAGYVLQFAFQSLGKQPPFSRRSVDFFLKDNAYDISKAKRELGFLPQVDLRTGLSETLAWQMSHGNETFNEKR